MGIITGDIGIFIEIGLRPNLYTNGDHYFFFLPQERIWPGLERWKAGSTLAPVLFVHIPSWLAVL